ncbi:hypothetical protein EMIT0P253_50319 [Pseudomonas sp. IT-P253]
MATRANMGEASPQGLLIHNMNIPSSYSQLQHLSALILLSNCRRLPRRYCSFEKYRCAIGPCAAPSMGQSMRKKRADQCQRQDWQPCYYPRQLSTPSFFSRYERIHEH